MDAIPLIEVPARLRDALGTTPPTYHAIWRAAVQGEIPATRLGGRWYVRAGDMPRVVAAFAPADQ